jgi:hypothetical protein
LSVAEQRIAQSTVLSIAAGQNLDVPDCRPVNSFDSEECQVATRIHVDALGAGTT